MKFIVIQFEDALGRVIEYPLIFPEGIIHAEMAEAVKWAIRRSTDVSSIPKAVAAGEALLDEVVVTNMRSESLGLGPRKTDEVLIGNIDTTKGVIRA